MQMKKVSLVVSLFLATFIVHGQEVKYQQAENIGYYDQETQNSDDYIKERCKLDWYYPKDTVNVPTVVWFYGGGLEFGSKLIPEGLKEKGIIVVAANYRLHPKVKNSV